MQESANADEFDVVFSDEDDPIQINEAVLSNLNDLKVRKTYMQTQVSNLDLQRRKQQQQITLGEYK